MLVESQFELVVIVDTLSDIIHSFLVPLHVGLITAELRSWIRNSWLNLQLLRSLVINSQTKPRIKRIEMFKFPIELISLLLEFEDLILLRSDVPLEVLNLVIKHKLEFL